MKKALLWGTLVLVAACPTTKDNGEVCGNGVDDDGDTFTDCDDTECYGVGDCPVPSGLYGPCPKCGQDCTTQSQCIAKNYDFDTPLPYCIDGKCQQKNRAIQVGLEVDTRSTWSAVTVQLKSINTRFVRKTTVDGGTVNCTQLQSVAASKTDPVAIEDAGLYNLQGFDVSPVSGGAGSTLGIGYINVGTGPDFLIWTELWTGPRDTDTKRPTGTRIGWGCFESGPEVAELKYSDNRTPDSGSSGRIVKVLMPPPQ